MNSFAIYVGTRIRHFRRAKNFTIEKLAKKINKSKSAVSKYESGQISVDLETLSDIAKALDVSVYHLIYQEEKKFTDNVAQSKLFGGASLLYVYYYHGLSKRLIKCVLRLIYDEVKDETSAYYYLDAPSFDSYMNSRYFYSGKIASYDTITYFSLVNQTNPLEHISLCILNSLGTKSYTVGIATGIAINTLSPLAMKILVSKSIIQDENLVLKEIKVTKDDLKDIKDTNMLLVHNY